ncbi:response regulator [Spirosoma sp. KCTC 42546]|uniref:response regulator n=1 Tax=Spirosoma sp. KCTC 42546 TaxID=2520506 RepID=UPI00115C089B|nr:response regulator [Spirosoma sp. KCTC 42546]QDK81901.1 response regulator [Spirosoma sp. KCTC 42546]
MYQRHTTILLTDDDDDDRYFLRQAIERVIDDLAVLEAKNGEEALALLQTNFIQLVILDMNMPGLNGLETLVFIRAQNQLFSTPVVMLSTSDQPELITSAYAKGINSFIKKPVHVDEYDQIADAIKVCFLSLPMA